MSGEEIPDVLYFFGGYRGKRMVFRQIQILLNTKEAFDLFWIGQNRLREIVHEDFENKYHLMLGRTIKIKRKQFEEFIDQVEQI